MEIPYDSLLLRIFIGESDKWRHQPLHEAIVLKAREMHIAGATVLRANMGFGKSSRLHTAKGFLRGFGCGWLAGGGGLRLVRGRGLRLRAAIVAARECQCQREGRACENK